MSKAEIKELKKRAEKARQEYLYLMDEVEEAKAMVGQKEREKMAAAARWEELVREYEALEANRV